MRPGCGRRDPHKRRLRLDPHEDGEGRLSHNPKDQFLSEWCVRQCRSLVLVTNCWLRYVLFVTKPGNELRQDATASRPVILPRLGVLFFALASRILHGSALSNLSRVVPKFSTQPCRWLSAGQPVMSSCGVHLKWCMILIASGEGGVSQLAQT